MGTLTSKARFKLSSLWVWVAQMPLCQLISRSSTVKLFKMKYRLHTRVEYDPSRPSSSMMFDFAISSASFIEGWSDKPVSSLCGPGDINPRRTRQTSRAPRSLVSWNLDKAPRQASSVL